MHIKAQPPDQEHQTLYNQFLAYMKGGLRKKNIDLTTEAKYKKIYSDLGKGIQEKRKKVQSKKNKREKMKTNGCKFQKISGHKDFQDLKKTYVHEDTVMPVTLAFHSSPISSFNHQTANIENNQDKIILEENQTENMDKEIIGYEKCIANLRKDITNIKKDIKAANLLESKYVEIEHLASNISQFTEQMTVTNFNEYTEMIKKQEDALKDLKDVKNKLKNQLYETQAQYHIQRRQNQAKFHKIYIPQDEKQNHRRSQSIKIEKPPKDIKRMLKNMGKVLQLLSEKQSNYQTIKQQQCTRIMSKPINTKILPTYRQWVSAIDQFESKFQIRVESSQKIIVKLFKEIREENYRVEKKILQKKQIVEENMEQYEFLNKKYEESQSLQQQEIERINEKQLNKIINKKIKDIHQNSILLVQVIELLSTVLLRFRYIFKVFIMMNIDKKKLNSHLLKLDDVLDSKGNSYSLSCKIGEDAINSKEEFNYTEDTNAKEIEDQAKIIFPNLSPQKISEMIKLLYNDIRVTLGCRRNLIIEEFCECENKDDWEAFLHCLLVIKDQCQYQYAQKIKICFQVLKDCLHSIVKGGGSKFFMKNSQIDLPPTMFPKAKFDTGFEEEEEISSSGIMQGKYVLQFIMNQQIKYQPKKWGDSQKKNPSQIIRKLQTIRNETSKKLKSFDINFNPYLYLKQNCQEYQIQKSQKRRITTASNQRKHKNIRVNSKININTPNGRANSSLQRSMNKIIHENRKAL